MIYLTTLHQHFLRLILLLSICIVFTVNLLAQQNFSFVHDGLSRSYTLYVPEYAAVNPRPLLLALHGFTQNGTTMMNYTGFNTLAETYDFVVAYPNGVLTSWNVGITGGSTADDVGFLTTLIDTIATKTMIDMNRVYATGFSNGGFMSYRLACEASPDIAAIAAVAGTMAVPTFNNCTPQRPIPVMHIHGTSDFVVPYNGNSSFLAVDATLEYWKAYNGCNTEFQSFTYPDLVSEGSTVEAFVWPTCNGESELRLLKVVNGGHTWPGNTATSGIGITNLDISASEVIWEFVSRFSTDQSVGMASAFSNNTIEINPNPVFSGSFLTVKSVLKAGNLRLYDVFGKEVMNQEIPFTNGSAVVQLPQLESGMYVLNLSGDTLFFRGKLIVSGITLD